MDTEYFVLQVTDHLLLLCSPYYRDFSLDKIYTDSDGYIYQYLLDNSQTANHTSAMFGIRELSQAEFTPYCPNNASFGNSTVPVTDNPVNFSANFYIRAYTSGCYYLDTSYNWKSDGLLVS